MDKSEFLLGLKKALSSTGSAQLIEYNLNYYAEYIDSEIAKGRTQEQVLAELGDPRLIANSIKDAEGINDNYFEPEYEEKKSSAKTSKANNTEEFKMYNVNPLSAKITLILVILAVVLVVFLVVAAVVGVVSFLWPVLAPVLLVVIVMWLMKFLSKQ